ncbi:hypothetical protein [Microlunatus speluncae]|uniref:hypothetical protein n=1 Tax=Microlunatus speluncae TaxID=2594267 RepID=UPI0012664F38|nr:hypothetical protein [Microlunatus speluncae]
MANQTINVGTWAKTVPRYGFRLADLDLYVLKEHDDILRALGQERGTSRSRNTLRVLAGLGCLFALVGGVSTMGGPILSTQGGVTSTVGEAGPLSDDLGVPFTAWCFVVVFLGVAGIAYRWLTTDRHSAAAEIGYLAAAVVCSGFALWQLGHDRGVDVLGFAPASVPVWATVVAAALLLTAVLFGSRGRRAPVPRHFRTVGSPDRQQVLDLVAALEPAVREKRLDQRRRAITRLRERGLIDEPEAAMIGSTPLGTSPTIDPRPSGGGVGG